MDVAVAGLGVILNGHSQIGIFHGRIAQTFAHGHHIGGLHDVIRAAVPRDPTWLIALVLLDGFQGLCHFRAEFGREGKEDRCRQGDQNPGPWTDGVVGKVEEQGGACRIFF